MKPISDLDNAALDEALAEAKGWTIRGAEQPFKAYWGETIEGIWTGKVRVKDWSPTSDLTQAMGLAMDLTRQYGPDGDAYDVGVLMYGHSTFCTISELRDYVVRVEIHGPPETAAPRAISEAVLAAMREKEVGDASGMH